MRYIFLLNRFGSRNLNDIINNIHNAAFSMGLDYTIDFNDKNKSTIDIINSYKNEPVNFVAVGGDGMINTVVNGIANTDHVFSYIPFGTGNDFHKTVKETLFEGENKLDLIKINDKYFINTACFGVDADIANDETFIHSKVLPPSQRYNASALYHFLIYNPRNMEVKIDQDSVIDDFTTIAVCNGRYYGGGYRIAPHAKLDDGELDIYLVKDMGKIEMAKTILSMKDGSHEFSKKVMLLRSKELLIKAKYSFKANIDGEILEDNIFEINSIHNGVTLNNNQDLIKRVLKK